MPRTLPWLSDGLGKRKSTGSKSATSKPPKRSLSPTDLVTSDLDIVPNTAEPPKRKVKRARVERTPSTSPPPQALSLELMKDGFAADDIYMMVEDEFDLTARLFTINLHREEYERVQRLARSRGAETLARIEHGTDGVTRQDNVLRMKMEAAENAKKRRKASSMLETSESSDDENEMDPQIAGLMMGSQDLAEGSRVLPGLGKAKSNTRAAAGYLQSPHKGSKGKTILSKAPAKVPFDLKDDYTDDDLDGSSPVRPAVDTAYSHVDPTFNMPRASMEQATPSKPRTNGFFKAFAKPGGQTAKPSNRLQEVHDRHKACSEPHLESKVTVEPSSSPKATPFKDEPTSVQSSRVAEALARRRRIAGAAQVKNESQTKVKQEPSSPSTMASWPRGRVTSPPTSTQESASTLRPPQVKQEGTNRRRQLDTIPTFLF